MVKNKSFMDNNFLETRKILKALKAVTNGID